MIYGYARVSTVEQPAGLAAQERDLRIAGATEIRSEQISAVANVRPQLNAILEQAREGDVIMVTKMDRLARSTTDLLNLVAKLEANKVGLVVLAVAGGQTIDTRSATGKLLLTMLAAIAAFERDLLKERQKEGIAKAKAEGKYPGSKESLLTVDVIRLAEEGYRPLEICAKLNAADSTVYRILLKYRMKLAAKLAESEGAKAV